MPANFNSKKGVASRMKTNLKRIKNHIENLSQFNSNQGAGLTRFSFTKAEQQARSYLKAELNKLGLEVSEDPAASILGRLPGNNPEAPVIMIGSHYDSVKNGGNFDGPAGVVMALEIMTVLVENDFQNDYPVEFIAMIEEEGGRFGSGVFGSRAMTGQVSQQELLNNKDQANISMAAAMTKAGFDPAKIEQAVRRSEDLKAFIELHIEQGPILESEGQDVGLVEFVVGINEFKVKLSGRPDHAGTTPMTMRQDALLTASQTIAHLKDLALTVGSETVATCGQLTVKPGAANIVPAAVEFTIDLRSKSAEALAEIKTKFIQLLKNTAAANDVSWELEEMLQVEPVELSAEIRKNFAQLAAEHDISYRRMTSGAGHDAMIMAALTEVGLIFVPSHNGRSHCPEEWTDYADLQKGIELIYHTVERMAKVDE
ncbi:allantoate deiminase [Halanaerobium salsuginis]|uniref:Allantoate deiminase n=2 Tax=Halanaerobium salsuginis TaxID=29563 RepID=A0A1I4G0L7_9FIRM|nr:allantoate deiminase [Halanaerobium salsuginis]